MTAKQREDLCPVHEEVQRRLDDRWDSHINAMEANFRDVKQDLSEIFSRLRQVEIRIWMALGGMAAILALVELATKFVKLLKG